MFFKNPIIAVTTELKSKNKKLPSIFHESSHFRVSAVAQLHKLKIPNLPAPQESVQMGPGQFSCHKNNKYYKIDM